MSDRMPKIDISKLSDREILYIKEVERKNLERVEKFRRMRRNNRITGSLLGLLAISIYGYSMYAVKQETFLDDFEEPQKLYNNMSSFPQIRLPPLPTVRDLVKLYRLRALRQLSQNFLMDERITDKIVKSAGRITDHYVCEVGPGPGSITRSILKQSPKKLIVVEKDPRFVPVLNLLKEACKEHTEMIVAINDIRLYNLEEGFKGTIKHNWFDAPPPIHLIGNLPFSVSTILIIRWLQSISEQSSAWSYGRSTMTLTFQKEVAERMIATPFHKQRCRLSVMCQFWCDVQHKFTIPGKAFVPKPDVDVGVVTLTPLKYPLVDLPFEMVEKVVRTIFNMRQKYSIRGVGNLFPEDIRQNLSLKMFELADLDYHIRPFQINNEEFARLCYAYKVICDKYPEVESYDFRAPKCVQ